ncbi:D-alanine--D-alanine ligase [Nocardioides sp. YIM 152315]|uniref:D-alanine--D-alanine ligase family protein n=1 Tax=Nocardioides sp. YIM 152315 TaxID=3031760 RepID=UPI0023DBDF22|nr:D-alanine--D-alanine ligase [Nocardioides sp. YIM 152315]MDF1605552.1 D-alanine--D-alanine ligase [Nocardioides sp. YIM 152315]
MRTRVAVVGGGQNCEHDVSLASAAAVAAALDPAAYDVVPLTIGRDGIWRDRGLRPIGLSGAAQVLRGCDVVFPVVHGPRGEDGALAALCELAGLPYVGSGVRPGALAMDKWATKLVVQAIGIATAPGLLVTGTTAAHLLWSHPVVVKPVAAGSSLGVSLVSSPEALRPALDAALALDERVLVEDVVVGREIDVAVLRCADGTLVAAPALEIVVDGLFDHGAKYGGHADFRVPARLDESEAKALEDAAVAAYDALGCSGVARIDFFLTGSGPVLIEVNTVPGMTEHSQVPRMFAAAGLSYPELLDELVRGAHR